MNYKISQLQIRYSLASKQSVYARMNALHIFPVKRGEISSESLDKLDKLDKFMKDNPGKKIWEFPRDTDFDLSTEQLDKSTRQLDKSTRQLDKSTGQLDKSTGQLDKSTGQLDKSTGQLDKSTGQLDNFSEILHLVETMARHFAANQDPLTKYKALEYAANHIMLLPTSKIKELTGAKPPKKNHYQRGTFLFTKTENKIGRETAWQIEMTPKRI
jgi:vacuolar-type H+-ATPase subunit I/STV1